MFGFVKPFDSLKEKALSLIEILKIDPFKTPSLYQKLIGDLAGAVLRLINIQHRSIYQVLSTEKQIKILRFWGQYE